MESEAERRPQSIRPGRCTGLAFRKNLAVSVSRTAAAAGRTVTIAARALSPGKKAEVAEIPIRRIGGNRYSFVMPERSVTVAVTAK